MGLPFAGRISANIDRVYAAISNLDTQCGVDQLLFFDRAQAIKNVPDSKDIVVAALTLDLYLTACKLCL